MALHAVLQTWGVYQHLNATCKQTPVLFCEKLILNWLVAAWTQDAVCANIEQQGCHAHFWRLLKAKEKHYHEVYSLWGLSFQTLFFLSELNASVFLRGEVYVYAYWAFCSGILTHWKSQCTVIICFTSFLLLIMLKTVCRECLPSMRSSFDCVVLFKCWISSLCVAVDSAQV